MEEKEIALRIEKIKRALEKEEKEKSSEDLRKEFLKYIEHGISPDETESRMLRKYGVFAARSAGTEKKISELTPGEFVDIKGSVVSIKEASSTVDGEERKRYYGILGDETGTIPFSSWSSDLSYLEKGDSIRMSGALVREWNGQPQLRVTSKSVIEKIDEDFDVKFSVRPAKEAKLCEIKDGMRVSVRARVMSIEEREITVRGEKKTIFSGILADDSGKIPFTAWKDFGLERGDVIKVDGAYARSWKGVPQLNIDERMVVEKTDEEFPSFEELDKAIPMRIEDIDGKGGVTDALFDAVVLQVRKGSGLIFRCPKCRRVLQDGICQVHGEVEGVPDLRIKAVIDDGTGAINAIVGRALTEKILGKDLDRCLEEARKKVDTGTIARQIDDALTARHVRIRGNVVSDDTSYTMITNDIDIEESNSVELAKQLIEEWGV